MKAICIKKRALGEQPFHKREHSERQQREHSESQLLKNVGVMKHNFGHPLLYFPDGTIFKMK